MIWEMDVDQVFVGTLVDTPSPGTLRVRRNHLLGELRSCHHGPTKTSCWTSGRTTGHPSSPFSAVPTPTPIHVVGNLAVADPPRFMNATATAIPIAIAIPITIALAAIRPQRAWVYNPSPLALPPHFRRDPLRPPTGPDPLPARAHLPPTHIHRPTHPRPTISLRRNRPRPPPDAVVGPVRVSGRRAY